MRVALSYSTVSSVNEKLGMLILGNLSGGANSVRLSVVKNCESWVSLSSYPPFAIGRDNVLIFSHWVTPPFRAMIKVNNTLAHFKLCKLYAKEKSVTIWRMKKVRTRVGDDVPPVHFFIHREKEHQSFFRTFIIWNIWPIENMFVLLPSAVRLNEYLWSYSLKWTINSGVSFGVIPKCTELPAHEL